MIYLGHIIGVDGVRVHEEKIRAIRDWPEPKNVTEIWGFVGIYTYYRKFVKGFSPLEILRGEGGGGGESIFLSIRELVNPQLLSVFVK